MRISDTHAPSSSAVFTAVLSSLVPVRLSFENNGVEVSLKESPEYLDGSLSLEVRIKASSAAASAMTRTIRADAGQYERYDFARRACHIVNLWQKYAKDPAFTMHSALIANDKWLDELVVCMGEMGVGKDVEKNFQTVPQFPVLH